MSDEPGISGPKRWRTSDFTRAIVELALALGWDVASLADVSRTRSVSSGQRASSALAASTLVLASADRRRLLVAELRPDGAVGEPRRVPAFLDTLRAFAPGAAADERDSVIAAACKAVLRVDVVVWRPHDLSDGSTHRALR